MMMDLHSFEPLRYLELTTVQLNPSSSSGQIKSKVTSLKILTLMSSSGRSDFSKSMRLFGLFSLLGPVGLLGLAEFLKRVKFLGSIKLFDLSGKSSFLGFPSNGCHSFS